jgi:hypothetical protein
MECYGSPRDNNTIAFEGIAEGVDIKKSIDFSNLYSPGHSAEKVKSYVKHKSIDNINQHLVKKPTKNPAIQEGGHGSFLRMFSTVTASKSDMDDLFGSEVAVTIEEEVDEDITDNHSYQIIIGVSANSDAETIQDAFLAGVDAFIPKPFTLQSFNDTFLNLMQNRSKINNY